MLSNVNGKNIHIPGIYQYKASYQVGSDLSKLIFCGIKKTELQYVGSRIIIIKKTKFVVILVSGSKPFPQHSHWWGHGKE
jgi:hypothetical protein